MMTFSERTMRELRGIMNSKNIMQAELADAMGVSEARVSQIFKEGSNLTLKSIDEIEAGIRKILVTRTPHNFIFVNPRG